MELRHLKYFIAVAEELHFGRAAKRLSISQPPLSHQIKQLEAELKVYLFNRTKQRVELTDAGKTFLTRVYEILNQVDLACDEVRRVDQGEVGQLVIGFTGAMVFDLLPHIYETYQRKFPKINIVLRQVTTTEQIESLKDGTIDVGLLVLPVEDESLNIEILREESLIVALPRSHHLANQTEPIDIYSLANERFIMTPRNAGESYYDSIISLCYQSGFSPRKSLEAQEIHTVASFVASGMGVALLPSSIQFMKNEKIVYLKLQTHFTAYRTGVAYNKNSSSIVTHSFISFLKEDIIPQL